MQINEYAKLAQRTSNPLLTEEEHIVNGVMGMCGEAGEACDIVKKWWYQGHPMNEQTAEHLAKEAGDCLWYIVETLEHLSQYIGVDYNLEKVMQMNIDKLKARYPQAFDSELSMHRKEGDI